MHLEMKSEIAFPLKLAKRIAEAIDLNMENKVKYGIISENLF